MDRGLLCLTFRRFFVSVTGMGWRGEYRFLDECHPVMLGGVTRLILYGVPALAVLVVAISLLVVAAPRPVVGARLYGGPSPDGSLLSFRLVVIEQRGERATVVSERPVRVEARAGGERVAEWEGELDAEGTAAVTLQAARPLPGPAVVLATAPWTSTPLAMGSVEAFSARPHRAKAVRGGWIKPPQKGDLQIRVAASRGVLAVPFEATLLVEVRQSGAAMSGVELELGLESLDLLSPPQPTNEQGRTLIRIRPTAHVAALEIKARSSNGLRGRWYSTVPVVGGAMLAEVSPAGNLLVTSPIPRNQAYYAVATERGRLAGGTIWLKSDDRGGARGQAELQLPRDMEAWVVLSSEIDLGAPSTVGWPVVSVERDFLAGRTQRAPLSKTFVDELQLDSLTPLLQDEARRQARVRRLTALFVATAMALVVMLLMLRVRDSERRLRAHLARAAIGEEQGIAPSRGRTILATIVAVLCVMLGFMILALLALFRG